MNNRFYYQSVFKDHTPVASSTAAGDFHVLNLIDFRAYTWWQPASLPATVTTDAGVSVSCSYCVVYGHDLATNGCTLEVKGSTDNFVASDVLIDTITPTDDEPFVLQFTSTSYRYWRVAISGTTPPSLAVVALGEPLIVPSWITPGFDPTQREPRVINNTSKKGHPLGKDVAYEQWSQSLSFQLVTWAWVRSTWLPAWAAHLRGNPFVFAWDVVNYPDELRLVIIDGNSRTPHQPGELANLSIKLMGVV